MTIPNKMFVTADTAVFSYDKNQLLVLLVKRKNPPFKDKFALPGGFVELNEKLESAARRELKEETSLSVKKLTFLNVYGDPGRDPRGRTITAVYLASVDFYKAKPKADDDAKEVKWFNVNKLPKLAFDHNKIVKNAVKSLVKK